MKKDTTNLNVIRKHPELFTWGPIAAIHDCGPYTIVETTDRHFHPYAEGEPARTYSRSLEGAMIIAIAEGHSPNNYSRDTRIRAAAMLLDIPSEDDSY